VAQTAPKIHLAVQVYDLASGESRQVAAFVPTESFLQVLPYYDQYQRSGTLWSPDSRNLVLAGVDANGQETIFVANADGSPSRKIADGDLAFWSWK
jgi:Tol biopolymer transport system component